MTTSEDPASIHIYPPDSMHASLCRGTFDVSVLVGKWRVVYSTLPMWKNKKDVSITYTALPSSSGSLRLDDLVEYRQTSASSSSNPSTIRGIDTSFSPPPSSPDSPESAVHFQWRGSGLLMLLTSKWQVIGHGSPGWAVTYFEKTLFTPAGMDIYVRDGVEMNPDLIQEIVSKTRDLEGEIGRLAQQFFPVKHGD